ncbi:uncharacterized protein LOC126281324 [Schistocerca gregaria]|uniref:uncharacterized protein LOC126281324 n=1 Tax=Schistocerca gregaria TaxID=7010 RepID=UPI00211DB29E|nr:uncharacterized protein LOC126281324 [Schistocerca gregaria]
MLISCKCLNVTIDTQSSEIKDVIIASLGLNADEEADKFFKETIYAVEHARISKIQSCLVQIRCIGNWIINFCLNCSTNTHAIRRDKGAAFILFTKAMLTDQAEISALKDSESCSPAFRIIVNCSAENANSKALNFSASQQPTGTKTAISALQQQLADVIQQETLRIDEAVRCFQEQQYAALEEFRERAHRDHNALVKLLMEVSQEHEMTLQIQKESAEPISKTPSAPHSAVVPSSIQAGGLSGGSLQGPRVALKQPSSRVDGRQANRHNPLVQTNSNSKTDRHQPTKVHAHISTRSMPGNGNGGSFDSEGLFDLDGMDDTSPGEILQSEDETDTDESGSHDEGIHIPRGRSSSSHLAKSLPVNVPAYVPTQRHSGEFEEDVHYPQDPVDIAASIRALAKSVHGESDVFGDLPRPRFSTQI